MISESQGELGLGKREGMGGQKTGLPEPTMRSIKGCGRESPWSCVPAYPICKSRKGVSSDIAGERPLENVKGEGEEGRQGPPPECPSLHAALGGVRAVGFEGLYMVDWD